MITRAQFVRSAILISVLWLSGCSQTPIRPIVAPNYSDLESLQLAVGAISVENLHDDRAAYPHVATLSPYPIVQLVESWVGQTFNPTVGGLGGGKLVLRILDASLIEEKLPASPGLSGLFKIDQSESYHGHVLLKLLVEFPDYQGELDIESRASQSVSEDVTLRERQQVWVDLGDKMVRDIDFQIRESLESKIPRLILAR